MVRTSPSENRDRAGSAYIAALEMALAAFQSLRSLQQELERAADLCCRALHNGNKILACGNGGSACEAQHLVGELMGRYMSDRAPMPALAINADSVLLTCIGNDYVFDDVFARQVQGLGATEDILVAFTTSGDSPNILAALSAARQRGVTSIAFLGRDGGAARALADHVLLVSHENTARIQEAHQFLLHALMDDIERRFSVSTDDDGNELHAWSLPFSLRKR
jgi:D-sedoheptulose 7-phosphate isomerase